jgi:hypothetical protein
MAKLFAFSGFGDTPPCPDAKIFDPATGTCIRRPLPVGPAKSNALTYAVVGAVVLGVAAYVALSE